MAEGEMEWLMQVEGGEPKTPVAVKKATDRPKQKQKQKPKKRRPHPLAGRSGEGAPIAPPGWLWKAGRRATDMYFCSPAGEKFRAKHILQAYLETVPDPPPFGLFRWTIKANEFKDVPLPGVPPEQFDPSEGTKRKTPDIWRSNKKRKPYVRRKLLTQAQEDKSKSVEQEYHLSTVNRANKRSSFPNNVQHIEQNHHALEKKKLNKKGMKKMSNKFFSQLLGAPTSYHILSKDPSVLRAFLAEAEKLKGKSEEDISELRNILLNRKYNSTRLGRYPEKVLRVFFSLLRNEEAPVSIGKSELIEFCGKWSCKHKHYWCLLETMRVNILKKQLLKAEGVQTDPFLLNLIEASHEKDDEGEVLDTPFPQRSNSLKNQRMGGSYNQSQEILEDLNRPFSATLDGMTAEIERDEAGHQVSGDFDDLATRLAHAINGDSFMLSAQPSCQNLSLDKRLFSSTFSNVKAAADFGSNVEASYRHIQSQIFGNLGDNTALGEQEMSVATGDLTPDPVASSSACHSKEAAWNECSEISVVPQPIKEGADIDSQDKKLKGSDSGQTCGCQICVRDASFCFGCGCSFCRLTIQNKEKWTYTKCPNCYHICHIECALKSRRAGVVEELGLDGEYLCPCCLEKCDLMPFWRERVRDALSCIDISLLQKHLTPAVFLLNGTHREEYQSIHKSIVNLYDTLIYNTPCPDLHTILHDIQEKLDSCADFRNQLELHAKTGQRTEANSRDALVLKEEEKLSECRKLAALDFVEWLSAEKAADVQRSFLRDVTELVRKAEENVNMKADRAKTSREAVKKVEKQLCLLKRGFNGKAISLEQFERQRAAVDLELSELNVLQEKVSFMTSELQESSAKQYSSLFEEVEKQRKRVLTTKARLEEMASIIDLFS